MVVVRDVAEAADAGLVGSVVTIGNFDGVHLGHRALLERARALASERGTRAVVLTFDPAPRDVLRPGNGVPRIQSLDRKLHHLGRLADGVVVHPFDATIAAMEPADFATRALRDGLGAAAVVVGHDFRFGRQRKGDAALLREVLGIEVEALGPVSDEVGPISSSRIREALGRGDVATAARLLGRPHELLGEVVEGDRRGRLLGFPTANLWPEGGLVPPNGVYAVRVELEEDRPAVPGVANLGTRPTFDGVGARLEVHLLDFSGDLYGRRLVVQLVDRLRDERRFASIDELKAQIERDAATARERLRG